VPLVRHQLDKQLTAMVLLQIIINVFTTLPFIILSTVQLIITVTDPVQTAVLQLILGITTCLYNSYFAVSMNTI
jgi:ABC-type methionine transport system permease subunit